MPNILGNSIEGKIKSAPAFTIVGRHKSKLPEVTRFPGPGAYDGNYEVMVNKSPQYTMAERKKDSKNDLGPGPGAFSPEKV